MFNPYQTQLDELDRQLTENRALLTDPELGELARAEIEKLTIQRAELAALAEQYLSDTSEDGGETVDPNAEHINCIVEVRGGAGGDEANIWANDLVRMYLRFADTIGLKSEFLDDQVIKFKGRSFYFSEQNIVTSTGEPLIAPVTAYQIFRFESGVHRVQRVPATEAQGRVHTSTASVAVLPEVSAKAVTIRPEDLDWQFVRAGGAGGQNVNKVNSAVRLTHIPSGVVTTARSERTQGANREIAMALLRSQLWEIEEEKKLKEIGQARSVIGRAQRAEKIRTYNYPQNRVTDHRIEESWYALDKIMEGELDDVVIAIQQLAIPSTTT